MKIKISGSPSEVQEKAEAIVRSLANRLNVDLHSMQKDVMCKSSIEPIHATLKTMHRQSEHLHSSMMQNMIRDIVDVLEEE